MDTWPPRHELPILAKGRGGNRQSITACFDLRFGRSLAIVAIVVSLLEVLGCGFTHGSHRRVEYFVSMRQGFVLEASTRIFARLFHGTSNLEYRFGMAERDTIVE